MKSKWVVVLIIGLIAFCCCLFLALAASGMLIYKISQDDSNAKFEYSVTVSVPGVTLEAPFNEKTTTPTPGVVIDNQAAGQGALETLDTLRSQTVPINDPRELAERLEGKTNIPETVDPPAVEAKVNDVREFWVSNVDTNENFKITAVLRYIGENCYFWVEDGVEYDEQDLFDLAETFDQKIYQTNREFFGSEWKPGVDQDPRLYVLFARGLGDSLAGYFSSADELHPLAHEYSNAHEMFLMNIDNVGLDEEFTYGVLAHEFQHMIHWYRDRNEESWLNEGFSELAAFLNKYGAGGFEYTFASNPDLQLNDWPNDPDATTPHYGAGFLFVSYFLDRFGEKATQALVVNPDNGMDSVDDVLRQLSISDAKTGAQITADDVFSDWTVTNYLLDERYGDGRYTYRINKDAPQVAATESFDECPVSLQSATVSQYGADYYELKCGDGSYTLSFNGASEVGVLPENAHSGEFAYWSNKGDESDMRLTRAFDFTGTSGSIDLSYWVWYDLEKDYDYLYLEASEDNGATWTILTTPSGTDEDISGNSYGWGYNGVSEQWIEETVDLSRFAGKKVLLRFEYVTDAAVNGEGLLLDDVSIPAIDYSADFETDNGGWDPEGFVRIENRLPQFFRLSLIKEGNEKSVETFNVQPGEPFQIKLDFGRDMEEAVLVVSGVTRFTRQPAAYQFSLE